MKGAGNNSAKLKISQTYKHEIDIGFDSFARLNIGEKPLPST